MPCANASSTRPAPAAMVSRAWASGVSPSATAAAMPPCAHALDAPCPIGAAVSTVTGRGLSLSAQNKPTMPPPMMITSWTLSDMVAPSRPLAQLSGRASVLQIHHALNRPPRPRCDCGIDHGLLLHVDEAIEDLRQGDALHVRAEIAGPHELDIGQFGLHVVGHRTFRDHDDARWPVLSHPIDHACRRSGVVGFCQHVRRALSMRDDM